jgi:hypothetical protein
MQKLYRRAIKVVCNFSNFMESLLRNVAQEQEIPSTTECIWNVQVYIPACQITAALVV